MKYLVDADVLSEATKPRPSESVLAWLREYERDLAVNPIVLGELQYGILRLPEGRRRARLLHWFEAGSKRLRLVEMDAGTARHWAGLLAELQRAGRAMPVKDSLIAASALQHKLSIATRNTRDYRFAGVELVNPFTGPPGSA